jgi:hypothetical protein
MLPGGPLFAFHTGHARSFFYNRTTVETTETAFSLYIYSGCLHGDSFTHRHVWFVLVKTIFWKHHGNMLQERVDFPKRFRNEITPNQ